MRLSDLRTPALLLDRGVVTRNTAAMSDRMRKLGVALRPHLKTAKCAEVARLATVGHFGGITVSTLAEAAFFARAGFRDITYAVGIVPSKLDEVVRLQRQGASLQLLTDDVRVARELAERAKALNAEFQVLIEIDTGGQRGGVQPEAPELLDIARFVHAAPGLQLAGVLTHAGQSYHCRTVEEVRAVAELERAGIVAAAQRLRAAGLPCDRISAGSTPTAVHAESLAGVTEMRPGNYVFFDLFQVGAGSCRMQDIAISVLASVIGYSPHNRHWLLDAGSLALSADTSAREHTPDAGYGLLQEASSGRLLHGLRVARVNQEHGVVDSTGTESPRDVLPIGSKVRILPNHSCITAAMFDQYQVVDGGDEIVDVWSRATGW